METGKTLIIIGIVLVAAGFIFMFGSRLPFNIGHLPGDINVKRDNFSFHFPVVTSIILSIVLSLIFYLINRFR